MTLAIRRKTTYNTRLRHRTSTIRPPEKDSSKVPRTRLVHTPFQHPQPYPTPTQNRQRLHMRIPRNTGPGLIRRPGIFGRTSKHREMSTAIGVDLRVLWQVLVPQRGRSTHRPIILPVEERAMGSQGYE